MMAICIYDPKATDFSTNGLGLLTPISCTISSEDGGMIELELIQPIDVTLRWAQLQKGCIIKAPVPTRESPLYEEIEDVYDTVPVTVEREIWKVHKTSVGVYMRAGPGTGYKKYGYLKNGAEVVVLEKTNSKWYHVCVVKGGCVCYMSTKYLTYSRSETEVIQEGKVIGQRVVEYMQSRDQLFRIYSVERDSKARTVKAKAMHIFYDQRANIVNEKYDPESVPINTALPEMYSKLMYVPEFQLHIAAGLETKISGIYGYKNPIENMLDPEDGMLAQANAILERDNFDMYILPNTTRDSGVTIRRGKNLDGVTATDDIADVVTRIIPCGKNKDGDDLFLDGTGYVDSPYINEYPFPYVQKIDYDCKTANSKKEADGETSFASDAETRAQLRKLAEEDFSKNGIDLPTYGMKVDFIALQDTVEYANYANLQAVFLHDTVTIIDSVIGISAKVPVSAYVWDCLSGQYISMSLGDVSSLDQTVYNYNLPKGGVSGSKIAPGTASGEILRNASIQYAKISVAAVEQLSANSLVALTAHLQEVVAGGVTTDELYAGIAEITKATIETADIEWASITYLAAAVAKMTQAEIGTADIDWAQIKDLATDTAIITEGVGGQLFINRLAVTEANMVSLTTGELVVKGEDGCFYAVSVDANGKIQTTLKQVSNEDVRDLSINAGEKIVSGTVTAACLNATDIFADNAIIRQMIAANLDVDELFSREAFISLLRTSRIVGDKTITMIAQEASEANRNFFQAEAPSASELVKPGDTWTIPATGEVYQAEDMSYVGLKFWLDSNANLCYSLEEEDESISLEVRGFDLYSTGIAFSIMEDGSISTPYRWVRVQDQELVKAIQGAAIHDGITPPDAPINAGKIWLDRSVTPPVFRRWKGEDLPTGDLTGWETVNDTQEISTLLAQVKATAEAAVSRAEQSHYIQAKPAGLHVGLLNQSAGYARVTYNSFDVVRADGYISASLGDARQDIGTMTMYATAEGHTAFVPREE